ncbi:hypothetical protein [Pseudidiomarina aestuarii]|uniref:hypothetical protein n=1 Tax=Pseudidiomarina aestuarii TaxID=624146 RepID=UPI003A96E345
MTNDLDLAQLAKSWQQQTPSTPLPTAADLATIKSRQRRQRWLMYVEWFGALMMVAAACWLVVAVPDALGYFAAAFLAVGAVGTFYASWQVHRPILAYDNYSSDSLLKFRLRTAQFTLRYYRYTQFSCAALVLFALLLWVLHWFQPTTTPMTILTFYSAVVAPLCLLAVVILRNKAKKKAAELARLSELLKDFEQ